MKTIGILKKLVKGKSYQLNLKLKILISKITYNILKYMKKYKSFYEIFIPILTQKFH